MARHGLRLIPVSCIAALASCGGGSDGSEADSAATVEPAESSASVPAPMTEPAPTDPPATDPPTTSTSTTTTLPAAWHRDTEMAVRSCLDGAMLGDEKVGFMHDFNDDSLVQEIIDLCHEAQNQLGVEDGLAASGMAVQVSEINMTLSYAVFMWASDKELDAGNVADLDGMFVKAFQAKSLIPA